MASLQSNSKPTFGLHNVMEIEKLVSAHNNHKINGLHPMILAKLVYTDESNIAGCTPLLLACHFGELAAVERIVESWGEDVNQAATYYFDPAFKTNDASWKIEKASPLFVAAHRGHVDIVQYLVGKGADVSVKTSNEALALFNGLTPLYAVLSPYRHLQQELSFSEECKKRTSIARFLLESGAKVSSDAIMPSNSFYGPIWRGEFCRVEALTVLIEYGMNVNKNDPNDPKEKTILDHWVKLTGRFGFDPTEEDCEESLAIVKLLLDTGADFHSRNVKGFTAIIQAANSQNLKVLDYLLARNDISQSEKIEALELAGAVILGYYGNTCPLLLAKAFGYWRQSLHLRQEAGSQKNLEIVRLEEWMNSEELENVIHQQRADQDIQSFLIQLRILSTKSWDAVYQLFLYCSDDSFILFRLAVQLRFTDVLKIQWIMLETIRSFDPREKGLWLTTLKVVGTLIRTLTDELERNDPLLNAETIKTSLKLVLATDRFHQNANRETVQGLLRVHISNFLRLITMLANLPQLMSEDSMKHLSELVLRSNGRDPNFGVLLLHEACRNVRQIDMFPTVDLLLRAGVDPNAGDFKGNGPLHHLAEYSSHDEPVAHLLLANGAHVDRVNRERKSAADVWKEQNARHDPNAVQMSHQQLPSWLREVPKLQCLSASVIRSYRVPFFHLPRNLRRFVRLH